MRATRARRCAALVVVALVTASCGARWSDDQKAEIASRGVASGSSLEQSAGPDSDVTQDDTGGSGTGSNATGATGTAPTGGGDGAAADAGGQEAASLPCAAASSAPGVTDDTITLGAISTLTGPVSGLGASAAGATRAYVAYRNATGGVCGRTLELRTADDTADNGRYRQIVQEMAPNVLGIAGGFAFGDVGGTDIVSAEALPVVNTVGSDAVQALPTVFDMNPPYPDPNAVIGKYRYIRDQGARTVSMTYTAVDQAKVEANVQRRLMEAAGLEVVHVNEVNLGTLSYDSAAREVASSGADYMFFIGDVNANGSMARSMAGTDHDPRFSEYFTFAYGTQFIDLAGPEAAEGATSWLRALPNADAGRNPEVAAFVEWTDRVAPGEAQDPFAADAWVAAKAFVDALEALPGPISREALVTQLSDTRTYDAGGMLGKIELGAEQNYGCLVAVKVVSGQWQRLTPAEGFVC